MKKTRNKMLKTLKSKSDRNINYNDIPELDERFLKKVEVHRAKAKERISLRLDPDIISWFKSQGTGYQSYINAVLKAFIEEKR